MSHKKFGPDRFSRFDVYWIQTNKQTNKQTDKPNLYIEVPGVACAQKTLICLAVTLSQFWTKMLKILLDNFLLIYPCYNFFLEQSIVLETSRIYNNYFVIQTLQNIK